MKLMQINTVCGRSSTGRIVADIARAAEAMGHACICVYGRYGAPAGLRTIKTGSNLSVFLHVLITRLFDRQGFGSVFATRRLIKKIKAYDPDVIHLHNLHGYYINIKILFRFLREFKKPVVWTLHDCWPFTGHCVHYSSIGCTQWKKDGCRRCRNKSDYPASRLLDRSRVNYLQKKKLFTDVNDMTITPVSNWLKSQVQASFLKVCPVRTIQNGIDLQVFRSTDSAVRRELGIGSRFIILCVQDGWSERKGLSVIKKLAPHVGTDAVIVMVGVQKSIKKTIPEEIIALPRTDSVQRLVQFYSAADVLLNPSKEETFGLVSLEALACGTPVIVTNATACAEIVDDTCGIAVNSVGDVVVGIIDALKKIREYPPDAASCRKRAEMFSGERSCRAYLSLYEEIIRQTSGKHNGKENVRYEIG